MQKTQDGIIFDIDGTLWDASENVANAWNRALKKFPEVGKELTAAQMRALMGKTMTDIFHEIAPDCDGRKIEEIGEICCREEEENLKEEGGALFPREKETLEALAHCARLFIVSNCQDGYIETFLASSGFDSFFTDYECFGRTGKLKQENIRLLMERNNLEKAVYVGDTQLDCDSAGGAGVPFVHAAYGYGTVPDAPHSVKTFAELAGLLPELLKQSAPLRR